MRPRVLPAPKTSLFVFFFLVLVFGFCFILRFVSAAGGERGGDAKETRD